jgi:hypothetical protein
VLPDVKFLNKKAQFFRALEWKMLVYLIVIWNILSSFGKFYGRLVYFSQFGLFNQEKYGNPV